MVVLRAQMIFRGFCFWRTRRCRRRRMWLPCRSWVKSLSLTCIWVDTRSSGTASISHAPEKVVLGRVSNKKCLGWLGAARRPAPPPPPPARGGEEERREGKRRRRGRGHRRHQIISLNELEEVLDTKPHFNKMSGMARRGEEDGPTTTTTSSGGPGPPGGRGGRAGGRRGSGMGGAVPPRRAGARGARPPPRGGLRGGAPLLLLALALAAGGECLRPEEDSSSSLTSRPVLLARRRGLPGAWLVRHPPTLGLWSPAPPGPRPPAFPCPGAPPGMAVEARPALAPGGGRRCRSGGHRGA